MSGASYLSSGPVSVISAAGMEMEMEMKMNMIISSNLLFGNRKTASNGFRTYCSIKRTWNPINNKKFETLSYLPPLSQESIAKEIDYMISKGWIPCLEFDQVGWVWRENSRMPSYYDGRYWTLWKLPMFRCGDASEVLYEIEQCKKAYPDAYIRCLAFDSARQAQCMSFLIHNPGLLLHI